MLKGWKWKLLYLVLAVLLALSLFVMPKVVIAKMNATKDRVITVPIVPYD